MSSFNSSVVLPSPSIPLALMSPHEAYQTMVSQYASVGAVAVLIWDILDNLPTDYRIFFGSGKVRWSIAMLVYISSRIGALAYVLGDVIINTAPTGNCAAFDKVVNAWCIISLASSAYLFFLRLRAIYSANRPVVAVFFVFWLALMTSGFLLPIGIDGGAIGATQYCEDIRVPRYTLFAQIAPLVFDTLVFLAISWRLSRIAVMDMGLGESIAVIFSGKNLPAFSKTLLIDGQIYYLITIMVGVPFIALIFIPGVPAPLQYLLEDPYLVVVNIMACRVYRRTRTGHIRESQISFSAMEKTNTVPPIQIGLATQSEDSVGRKEYV